MAELNEEQLLLLNNLMYYEGAAATGNSVEDIAKKLKVIAANYDKDSIALSGGYENKPEQIIEIANAILEDEQLCELVVVDSINTEGVRASCFVDADGNATVAVRGTGGSYEAWGDNVEGAYGTGTECQKAFQEFIHEQGENYSDITVTGHSKGGNLAQYATVLEGQYIDRCVSFDGQGFSNEFCEEYKEQIAANQGKIKSVCGESDYVNILLKSIAGETVYLQTTEGENAHSSYALWEKNQGTLMDGKYSALVEQATCIKVLDLCLDVIVCELNFLPDFIEKAIFDSLGSLVGVLFAGTTGQLSVKDMLDAIVNWIETSLAVNIPLVARIIDWDWIKEKFEEIAAPYIAEENTEKADRSSVGGYETIGKCSFAVKSENINDVAGKLAQCKGKLTRVGDTVSDIKLDGGSYWLINMTIKNIGSQIRKNSYEMNVFQNTLLDIRNLYNTTETNLYARII